MSDQQAYEVPLIEQLESVPADARLTIESEDGLSTRYIPVGRMCQEAAAVLRSESRVSWGIDWGKAGDKSCATIIKQLPDGKVMVMAVEYEP
jgi:hypothetical protein